MKKWILIAVVILSSTANLFSQLSFEVVWEKQQGGVIDAKFSPDGKFVYCLIGGDIKKLDVITGEFVATFNRDGFTNTYAYLEITQDGKYILTGGYDGSVNLWNTEQQKIIRSLSLPEQTEKQSLVFSTFSPDNKTVLVTLQTSHDFPTKPTNEIVLYDFIDNKVIKKVPFKRIGHIQFSKDGKYFITGTKYEANCRVTLWDAKELTVIREFTDLGTNDNGFRKIQLSDNNMLIGVRTETFLVKIIETESGDIVKTSDLGMLGYNFEIFSDDYYLIYQWIENQSFYNSNIYKYPNDFQSNLNVRLPGVLISKTFVDEGQNNLLVFNSTSSSISLFKKISTIVNEPKSIDSFIKINTDKIIVSFDNAENIKIIDMQGNILFEIAVTTSSLNIPNSFSAGTYICVVKSGDREYSQKFQVVR